MHGDVNDFPRGTNRDVSEPRFIITLYSVRKLALEIHLEHVNVWKGKIAITYDLG